MLFYIGTIKRFYFNAVFIQFDLRFYIAQIIPPLVLLLVLNAQGPGLWFIMGLPALCGLISLLSIIIKLFQFKKNKQRLIRPLLTVLIFVLIFSVAQLSYKHAHSLAQSQAQILLLSCQPACPKSINGWQQKDEVSRSVLGDLISYPVFYRNKGNGFELELFQSNSFGDVFSGQAGGELRVERWSD